MDVSEEDISAYESQVKAGVHDPRPYDRLMIHHRKAKQYTDELKVIKKGIDVFEQKLKEQHNHAFGDKKNQKKLHALSISIGKKVGLIDTRGKSNYLPEPLDRWEKRKKVVEEKIGRKK
jgi:hypothetical protein